MRISRNALMFVLLALVLLIPSQTNQVQAIGVKSASTGCKKFSDQLAPFTSLKVEDNGKEVVIDTGLSFDKDDQLIFNWEVKDNKGQVLQATGTLVLKDGIIDANAKDRGNVFSFTASTTRDVKIKITVADPTSLGSISYKITCYSAYLKQLEVGPAIWP